MMLALPQIAFIAIILLVALRNVRFRHSNQKLPPSPPGIPLLGSLLQVPRKHLSTYFRHLLEEFGGLVSLNLAGFCLVLIGDIKVAKELLEKHAAKHSSRPIIYYIRNHLDPTESYWSHSAEGPTVSLGRRLSMGIMSSVRAGKTESLQEFEAMLNVQKLLDDGGKDWFHHAIRFSASTALAAAYGLHCPTGHEPALKKVRETIDQLVVLFNPTASIINALPFLDLIPGPMPWRARARAFHEQETAIYDELLDHALIGRASGMNTWAAAFAREDKPGRNQGRLLKTFSGAAIETTAVSVQTFVLACIRHLDWVATAQEQIDAVVGPDRLPSFKDRPFLPYIEAIVRETLRWRPAVRSGMPHQSVADDTIKYRGQTYFIPKGAIIFPVTWAIEHDQSRFEDHDRFMPERFLDAEGNLKPNYEPSAFGFGRRGIPFAERSLWICVATLLWTFNIRGSDALDPNTGQPFQYDDSDAAFNGDLTNALLPFPAVFEPRSLQKAEVARREWAECEKNLEVLLPAPKEG
ncbi:hypothetical protein C0992_010833 [Termitomyces sp. T32_za158]|nr:hypothetical protein C0992_010833 [Termitomyces sp. T32_za158]